MNEIGHKQLCHPLSRFVVLAYSGEIEALERKAGLPRRSLRTALALHIFKYSVDEVFSGGKRYCGQNLDRKLLGSELDFLTQVLLDTCVEYADVLSETAPPGGSGTLLRSAGSLVEEVDGQKTKIEFKEVDSALASEVFEHYHYIGSFREDTVNTFGLYRQAAEVPFVLCAFSTLDRRYLLDTEVIRREFRKGEVACLSRVFGFENAPRNAISVLLSQCSDAFRKSRAYRAVVSAVNHNLLFSGSSYLASNFKPFALTPIEYRYVDGLYASRRVYPRSFSSITWAKTEPKPITWYIKGISKRDDSRLRCDLRDLETVPKEKYEAG
ncbi:hypothetical protein [Gordonibacter massiliensis (ex Traore et al. 2017)]|uniref:Uncharacterized protein n=1 Tax=Gordonibacter massiliensis (ex Traore et al. 2017) TaxID=1841863 RepID=A0A842JLC7_9ACTN|nr:hypothetical protein [Gordonibacter massiliensis (ex Traore et al. 2017)]MBC2889989.1 hypothetical protein [Gordonibacter massiliensis (ex Traore et al. 2017)]